MWLQWNAIAYCCNLIGDKERYVTKYVHEYVNIKWYYKDMGRRIEQRNVRNLTKVAGHSFGLTFPIELIRKLGWRSRQKLTVTPKGKKLIVKDWKK